jgi:hypothetical protein
VTSFERRAERLEQMFSEPSEARRIGPDPDWCAILDELASLKASRAVHYRGGKRIEGEDLPRKLLGENYTRTELLELAIARGLEKRGYGTAEVAELLPRWLERFSRRDPRGVHSR